MAEYTRLMVVCSIALAKALERGSGGFGDFCVELSDACIAKLTAAARELLRAAAARVGVALDSARHGIRAEAIRAQEDRR